MISDFGRKVRIGSQLSWKVKEELVAFLRDNDNAFAWSYEDMTGTDPLVMVHKLNADPDHKAVK